MKAPSRNISASLRSQSPGGRGPAPVEIGRLKACRPSMTAPGEGRTSKPPGGPMGGGRDERSAANFADVLGRKVGG